MTDDRNAILDALEQFTAQKPGLDPRDYMRGPGDIAGRAAYYADARAIARDLHHARALLAAVRANAHINAGALQTAFKQAYAGRLACRVSVSGVVVLDYTTGQYWPMEYRRAACAVLANALWAHARAALLARNPAEFDRMSGGDYIRAQFRAMFGRGLARRWFA